MKATQRSQCRASVLCPRCGRTSYNPNDVRERYCRGSRFTLAERKRPMSALTDGAKKRLALHGPDRVLVNLDGTAVSQFRAKTEFGVEADVILIRADGWMLGAPWKLIRYARSIWKNEWAEEIIINPDTRPKKADVTTAPTTPEAIAPVPPKPGPEPAPVAPPGAPVVTPGPSPKPAQPAKDAGSPVPDVAPPKPKPMAVGKALAAGKKVGPSVQKVESPVDNPVSEPPPKS